MNGSNLWLAGLDAWVRPVVKCLREKEPVGGHRQEMYADTHGRLLLVSMEKLTINVRVFMEYWAGEELVRSYENALKRANSF